MSSESECIVSRIRLRLSDSERLCTKRCYIERQKKLKKPLRRLLRKLEGIIPGTRLPELRSISAF